MTPVAADTIASATVKVNGAPLDQGLMDFVEKIEVRSAVGLPDMATVRLGDPEGVMVGNADSTKTGLPAKPPFEIADEIEISLGDPIAHRPVMVFKGEIVALETEFDTSAATIAVRAYDRSHRLQRGRKSRTFLGQTSSDVVRSVVADAGIQQSDIETTSTVHDFLQQSMESDWDLCRRLAAGENMEFGYDANGDKAFLRRERKAEGATPEIKWRENLLSFKPRMTTVQQPTRVVVRSYDPATKQELVGTATSANGLPAAVAAQRDKAKKFGEAELLVSDRIANTQGEVQQIAQSTMDHLASGFFEADGVTTGNPHLRAGGQAQDLRGRPLQRRVLPHERRPELRARQLQDPLRHLRPALAHAHRRHAAEGGARLGRQARRGARHEPQRPGVARAREGQAARAGRHDGEHLGARGDAARRPEPRPGHPAHDRRRGRRRLRARRHAPGHRPRRAAQRQGHARQGHARQPGGRLARLRRASRTPTCSSPSSSPSPARSR